MKIRIKAQPNASKNEIIGFMGDELKIRVSAPPESGKANKAIESLLAQKLGVKKSQIRIVSGLANTHKVIEISNLNEEQLKEKLRL
jgi:uncharacterized protein